MPYIYLLLAAALILFPGTAQAQREFGVNAGLAIPFGTLNDASGPGFGLAADGFVTFADRYPNLLAGGRIGYNRFGKQNYPRPTAESPVPSSSAFNVEIVPSLRYKIQREGKPQEYFLQLGAGLYFTSINYTDFPGGDDKNSVHLGLSVGGGMTYRLMDNLYAVAAPLYNATKRNYLTLNIGLMYGDTASALTTPSLEYRRR